MTLEQSLPILGAPLGEERLAVVDQGGQVLGIVRQGPSKGLGSAFDLALATQHDAEFRVALGIPLPLGGRL